MSGRPNARRSAASLRTVAATLGAALAGATLAHGQTMSFTELFNGTLDGWSIEDTQSNNFSVRDGVLLVEAPEGWLKSERRYADFELEVEFRFLTDDADSGIFVRASGTGPFRRGWPNESYQVQMRNPLGESRFPPIGGLFRHGMPDGPTRYDEPLARELSRPTGEWQTLSIRVVGAQVTAALNGTQVLEAGNIANPEGFIGIQGETGALEFRSIAIREL